jgi:hypothetical protein
VLRALLVAVSLEGLASGLPRIRRPIAVVRRDRRRDVRVQQNLRELARHLSARDPVPVPGAVADWRWLEPRSGGGGTGANVVFFRTG